MYRITAISDTHNKHKQITSFLPGGDILIHSGDISSMGHKHEIQSFCDWFDKIDNYDLKVFIAGNHDYGFEKRVSETMEIVNSYKWITYLQDDWVGFQKNDLKEIRIWGSPWQPEFYNWAFNLPRNGAGLMSKWEMIPEDTDILITHGPACGYVDTIIGEYNHLGCELLTDRIGVVKPDIHICGHIHSGYGYATNGKTHFINASVLSEGYYFTQKPITFDYNPNDGSIVFI
jgi:Icc-related predicted phosphoesterase